MSARCEHGYYADKCEICILSEANTRLQVEPQDWQEPGPATILYREYWDERDGATYDIMTDGAVVGIYHRSVDGAKVPAGIFWAMVKMLEDEGVRP